MDDLISRQAAIDEIKALYEWHDTVTEDRAVDHLKRLPSVQPEPSQVARDIATILENEQDMRVIARSIQPERKKGKWIEVNDAYNRISGRCSACGWETHMYEDDVVGMPFCPSCGADMREEK